MASTGVRLRQQSLQNWVKMFAIVESHKDTRRNIVFTNFDARIALFLSPALSAPFFEVFFAMAFVECVCVCGTIKTNDFCAARMYVWHTIKRNAFSFSDWK